MSCAHWRELRRQALRRLPGKLEGSRKSACNSIPFHSIRTRFLTASGRAPFAGEVLVSGNRITAVAEGTDKIAQAGAEIINCHGATLMPGLVESHAHLSWPSSVGRIFNGMMMPPEEHLLVTAHNARVTLDAGFTSAYSAGSLGTRFEIALKKEIEGGWLPGPRLISSSLEQGPKDVLGVPPAEGNKHGRGVEAMRDLRDRNGGTWR